MFAVLVVILNQIPIWNNTLEVGQSGQLPLLPTTFGKGVVKDLRTYCLQPPTEEGVLNQRLAIKLSGRWIAARSRERDARSGAVVQLSVWVVI